MKLLIALAIVIFLYDLQDRLYRKYWNTNLSTRLSFSTELADIGDSVTLSEVIENNKALPLPILYVKFKTSKTFHFDSEENANVTDHYYRSDAFSVLGRQRITRQLHFKTTKRGYFTINELQITSKNLFVTKQFTDVQQNHTHLYVLPDKLNSEHFLPLSRMLWGDFYTRQNQLEDPFAFRNVRPYQSFDTMNRINWKSTAHTGNLMVNQYQSTISGEVRIFLNLTPYQKAYAPELAEHAINIAYTIGSQLVADNIDVSLYTNGIDGETEMPPVLPAGHGKDHPITLGKLLARLDITKTEGDFLDLLATQASPANQGIRYIIISTYRDNALYDYFEMQQRENVFFWIIPELESTEIKYHHENLMKWNL